ncbi:peptidoglycan D,D-transpeptidase FtsI family protein [Bacillus salitolerans]|uniref:serine-type D-Ala-D-Ala carboxypeptidase n=1 Tax=Bacillus salitolerans TaxID=1437434 RepID=A0ABW4LNA3_9BACI
MKNKKKKNPIPLRLNILFFIVFLLFSCLILRLGVVQIVYGENYKKEIERTDNVTVHTPVPRGKILDRHQRVMVDNLPVHAITYTAMKGISVSAKLEIANRLADIIEKDTTDLTVPDLKDYWILTKPELAEKKISNEEKKQLRVQGFDDRALYKELLNRITEEDLAALSEKDMEVAAIKREFDKGYALIPQIIKKEGVTKEELSIVSEHLSVLPGVDITTDWLREYVFGDTLKSVLGSTTSSDEGIPRENLDFYLARDYALNDRVGKSYIEQQYEDVLRGQKKKIQNVTDKTGHLLNTLVISEGQQGSDVVLTIDMDLQLAVEKIIEEELLKAKRLRGTELLESAFVVMMDPSTGEILTMAGKQIKKKQSGKYEMSDYALGNITTGYEMGSAIKGATVLTGYETGVIHPGTVMVDEPIRLKATPTKASYVNMGRVSDLTALKRSSNVYMFKIAMLLGGAYYHPNMALVLKDGTFEKMRNYFSQFGLGVKTGIDLPNEFTGYTGVSNRTGFILDLAIGQYDTYTPMQLAQYVSTIANDGFRMKPHLVKEIVNPSMDENQASQIVHSIQPEVMNRIDMDQKHIDRVQEGFRQVMQERGGTAANFFKDKFYKPAGKTGTAQAVYWGQNKEKHGSSTYNLTLVGYAPFHQPEIAFAVVVPWAHSKDNENNINKEIGERILDTYFELKARKAR